MQLVMKTVEVIDHVATGAMVRMARKTKKLSLVAVGARLKNSVPYLSALENGKCNWTAERLEKIQKAIAGKKRHE